MKNEIFKETDVRVDTYNPGNHVRMVHMPTCFMWDMDKDEVSITWAKKKGIKHLKYRVAESLIDPFSHYTHHEKGGEYIIQGFVEIKQPDRSWSKGVSYMATDPSIKKVFIRDVVDFAESFNKTEIKK